MTKVLLLGGPGGLTRAVANALGEKAGFGSCSFIDATPEGAPLLPHQAGFDAAVVLGAALGSTGWPPGRERAEAIFRAVAASGVRVAVVVSSAAVFPPRHPHPGMVDEEKSPLRGASASADAWSAFENAARAVFGPVASVVLTILRPAAVPTPDGNDYWSRLLRGRLCATFLGHDPSIQLLSAEDLGRAVASAVRAARGGLFHVAPAGVVPVHKALSFARTLRIPLPAWLHRVGRRALRGLGVAPWADAERIRYPWTVSGRKLEQELGFAPLHSSAAVAAAFAGDGVPQVRSDLPEFDPYGQDKRYIAWLHRSVMGFLHNIWWRVEVAGIENVPRQGPAVLAGVHRGFMPFDGTMILYDMVKHRGRYPRFLIHPTLAKEVFLSDFIIKQGGIVACRQNADFVLQSGELLGYFPEGVEGAFSYYKDAYRLREDFGRDEFVKTALRNRVPIIPIVTVGGAEMFPVLAKLDWGWWKRVTEWPCFPIAPPFPLLPVPFPSKWHTRVLAPLPVHLEHGPEAAFDPRVVAQISAEVRRRLQAAIDEMLARRRWIFFGSIFEGLMELLDLPKLLPHRPPILMLDRVVEVTPGVSGVGQRSFRPGDACFEGHFPGRPVLPGVLMIEALAQTALAVLLAEHLAALERPGPELPLGYLARVQEMSFQRPIEPGQTVRFEVEVEERLGQFSIVKCRVTRDGELCAKGKLAVAVDRKALDAALAARLPGAAPAPEEGE